MWRKLWGPHPAGGARPMGHALVKHWVSGGLFLERLLGDHDCGLVALEAYFSDHPEVTAEYVAHRLEGYLSDDTARRRLKEMSKAGIVSERREGRTVYFKLKPEFAEAALAFMKGEPVVVPSAAATKAA